MKFAAFVLMGILAFVSSAPLNAQSAGTSQVVMAYVNEPPNPSPLTGFDGLCLIYYTLVGNLDQKTLFAPGTDGTNAPAVDRKHAHFIWVSDYTVQPLSQNATFSSFMVPEGTAAIYYTDRPELRDWTNRNTWGDPVARFIRRAGMFLSKDGGVSGTLTNTAELVSSKPFTLNGTTFDFKNLMPHGLTCFETADGDYEAGSCVAVGSGSPQTIAVANPKNLTVTSRVIQLDGSNSTSANGKPLTYLWTVPQGSPMAAITGETTATPTIQFGQGRAVYTFQLTVTDSDGRSSTDLATINFQGN